MRVKTHRRHRRPHANKPIPSAVKAAMAGTPLPEPPRLKIEEPGTDPMEGVKRAIRFPPVKRRPN